MSREVDQVVNHGLSLFVEAQAMRKGPAREAKIARAATFLRRAGDRRRHGAGMPLDAVNFYVLADLVAADEGCYGPFIGPFHL